ncbi:hypothetical protein GK047_07215 [Paenibacillus sp. SYP-B3998]|uniref:Uncharacterized protein n=1 Tax=Paenibacillus sp. SYP-B3998 TaxID=2678564 RepID=A0A6G3ZWL3_9BACL|nr:hypothetical protein [Paenibacillus sp. SYP-B3998]NEW05807.1 hypothetical protein [Paenibacillus sp. SYP-B3998]
MKKLRYRSYLLNNYDIVVFYWLEKGIFMVINITKRLVWEGYLYREKSQQNQ